MKCRHAKDSDFDRICDILATAFSDEPVHKRIFEDREPKERIDVLRHFFRIYVNLAKKYGGTLLDKNNAGALVYFRPEAMEITNEELAEIDDQLRQVCGSNYAAVSILTRGAQSLPSSDPCALLYISACGRSLVPRWLCNGSLIQ